MSIVKDRLLRQIEKGKINLVIHELRIYSEERSNTYPNDILADDIRNQVFKIQLRYHSYKERKTMGVLSQDEGVVMRNKIRMDLIRIIREIEEKELAIDKLEQNQKTPYIENTSPPLNMQYPISHERTNQFQIQLFVVSPILLFILVFLIRLWFDISFGSWAMEIALAFTLITTSLFFNIALMKENLSWRFLSLPYRSWLSVGLSIIILHAGLTTLPKLYKQSFQIPPDSTISISVLDTLNNDSLDRSRPDGMIIDSLGSITDQPKSREDSLANELREYISYFFPSNIVQGKDTTVSLSLGINKDTVELVQALSSNVSLDSLTTKRFKITDFLEIELLDGSTDSSLTIRPLSQKRQLIRPKLGDTPQMWRWAIRAKYPGYHHLMLKGTLITQIHGQEATSEFLIGENKVNAKRDWIYTFWSYIKQFITVTFLIVVIPVLIRYGYPAFLNYRDKKHGKKIQELKKKISELEEKQKNDSASDAIS